jgi:hypothetical protein
MPAKSKSQQRLMGMVYAYQEGRLDISKLPKPLQKKIKSMAKSMPKETTEEYARTKHKGLPNMVPPEGDSRGQNKKAEYVFEKYSNKYTRTAKRFIKWWKGSADDVVKKSVKKSDNVVSKADNVLAKVDDVELVKMYPNSETFSGARIINYKGNKVGHVAFDPFTKKMEYININDAFQGRGIGTKVSDKLLHEYGSMFPDVSDISPAGKAL